jgi:hypothetical protein
MVRAASIRWGAWLALLGLTIQIGLSAAHFVIHPDHLLGRLVAVGPKAAAATSDRGPASPLPGKPATPDQDDCPICLGLLLSGTFVLADPGLALVPPATDIARLDAVSPAFALPLRRHLLPLARAPPVIEILA